MRKSLFATLMLIIALSVVTVACKNEVKTVAVTDVTLDRTSASMVVGEDTTLTETVLPTNATNKNVTWSSSNDSVATVEGGVVLAKSAGKAIIKVTTADGGKTAECAVTVSSGYLRYSSKTGVSVTPSPNWDAKTKEYSTDEGRTWNSYKNEAVVGTSSVMFRGLGGSVCSNGAPWETSGTDITVSGDIMTLLNYNNPEDVTMNENCFQHMFANNKSLIDASKLNLSANTLEESCYESMFSGCTSLETAPNLPATTLADYCYSEMFYGCTSLKTAPELPATTLEDGCYCAMFSGCTSIETAPYLSATDLAKHCYCSMFEGCTSLKNIQLSLPATTLKYSCYLFMFKGCTSLTKAPYLPATVLEGYCYCSMFEGCSNLKISTSGNDDNKIFKCPDPSGRTCPVLDMFKSATGGSFKDGTPIPNNTYYWNL